MDTTSIEDARLGVETHQELWGKVAAVRRSVAWVATEPERLAGSPYFGRSCARMVASLLSDDALPEAARPVLEQAAELLAGLDDRPADERSATVAALDAALDAVVPLGEAGATPLLGLRRKAELIIPGRRRRGRRRDDGGDSEKSEAAGLGGPEADAAGAEAAGADAAGADAAGADGEVDAQAAGGPQSDDVVADAPVADDGAEAADTSKDRRRGRRRGRRRDDASPAARDEPRASEPAPVLAPPPPPLPLGHPDGTGASVSVLPGLRESEVAALAEVGVVTVADLLLRPPVQHSRASQLEIGRIPDEQPVIVRARVLTRCTRLLPGGRRLELVLIGADGARLSCRWVSSVPRGWERWRASDELAFVGDVEQVDDGWVMVEGEPVGVDGRGSGLMPRYGIDGVSDATLREAISAVLSGVCGPIADPMPSGLREHHRLLALDHALRDAHFPANTAGRGRVRLAFEEFLLLQLGLAQRSERVTSARGIAHKVLHGYIGQLEAQHGIVLDDSQELAFADIRRDLLRSTPMTRLLQGDVGAGKGLVALFAAVAVAESRCQVAMLSPDALSAERRFVFAEGLLRSIGIVPLLAGDTLNHAQTDAVRRGEAHIVFGSVGLLGTGVPWRKLGLIVVEERDTYGAIDPGKVAEKGAQPDLLVVTRAPIPTSLVFTVFGDYDLSVVSPERQARVSMQVSQPSDRPTAYAQAREAVEAGGQAFVVFPVDEAGRDLLGPQDALRFAEAIREEALPGARIGVYCSAMGREERYRVFDDFKHRRIDVLVATTYVEDAPAVANATAMVVEYADRHDLVRLHRLRGHVGMGLRPGSCALVLSDSPSDDGMERVEMLVDETDGFRIAELDLQQRGAKALLGERAAEAPVFRWADPARDRALLLRARAEAFAMVGSDPSMRTNPDLADTVSARWGGWLGAQPGPPPTTTRGGDEERGRKRRRRRRR